MAEPRFKSPPPSHIPVMSPRRSETMTSLPSSLNVPNLGLVPPNRRPSGSAGSPSVTFQSTPPITSTNTGFHSLRNLRNFLPFGNTKIQTPSGNSTGYGVTTANSGSANKKGGAVRRSMVVDRKPSWTSTSGDGSQSGEQDEVIVIDHGRDGRSASESSQISADTRHSLSPPAPPPKDLGTYPSPLLSTSMFSLHLGRLLSSGHYPLSATTPETKRYCCLSCRLQGSRPDRCLTTSLRSCRGKAGATATEEV